MPKPWNAQEFLCSATQYYLISQSCAASLHDNSLTFVFPLIRAAVPVVTDSCGNKHQWEKAGCQFSSPNDGPRRMQPGYVHTSKADCSLNLNYFSYAWISDLSSMLVQGHKDNLKICLILEVSVDLCMSGHGHPHCKDSFCCWNFFWIRPDNNTKVNR